MRPVELTVSGFRSFADPATFRFDGRRLVGIVGPIGSGKSSILDAISFALYGKTARVERDTRSLIHQRRDVLQVSLVFSIDGVRWRVVRALRRTGAAAHTLYREEGGAFVAVADKARDVSERISGLLGLEFDAFRRSVLLAQNQFAAFLEATATERDAVLKGVFGFERLDTMRAVARGRIDAIAASLQALAARRASAEVDRLRLLDLHPALAAAEERSVALEGLRGSVMQADGALAAAEASRAEARDRAAALDEVGGRIPGADEAAATLAAASRAEAEASAAEEACDAAARAVAEAEAGVVAAFAAVGGADMLAQMGDAVARLGSDRDRAVESAERARRDEAAVAASESALAECSSAVAAAEVAAGAARAELAAAEARLAAARQDLHRAHDADRAAALRRVLVPGEPCPVCAQTVTALPAPTGAVELAGWEDAMRAAESAAEGARTADLEAAAVLAGARAAQDAADRRLAAARETAAASSSAAAAVAQLVAGALEALAGRLGPGDPVALLRARRSVVSEAERAVVAAREVEARAQKERVVAERARSVGRTGLDRLRTTLAGLAGRLGMEPGDDGGPEAIDAVLRGLRAAWVERRQRAMEDVERADRAAAAAREARVQLMEAAGLAATDDIVEIATEALRTRTALETEVRVLEQRLAELTSLGAEEADAVHRKDVLERLHADLADSRFLRFLLEERRRHLADLGGVHLEVLTGGRYRFTEDGGFDIVDLAAADRVRSANSLSGGESFLASLALALALAEIVTREGGRLDAFLLDEGFGSLDPEHLDLAMDGVERLVAAGADRLVVVVSHVPALRERFEDLIVLDRDPVTGATRVVAGGESAP